MPSDVRSLLRAAKADLQRKSPAQARESPTAAAAKTAKREYDSVGTSKAPLDGNGSGPSKSHDDGGRATGDKRDARASLTTSGDDEDSADPSNPHKRLKSNGATGNTDSGVDEEWQRFQAEVLGVGGSAVSPAMRHAGATDDSSRYVNATVEVKPSIRQSGPDTESRPQAEQEDDGEIKEETAEQRRSRIDRESREEILSRIEEEQRLQEEADDRVRALKSRLASIRSARTARTADGSS